MGTIKDSVAIAIPCAGGVEPRVVRSAMGVMMEAMRAGVNMKMIGVTDRSLIHSARNWLSKEFLDTDCEWLFWMDSDMILEPRTIPVMLEWAKRTGGKFMTGIYYQRMGEHEPVIGLRQMQSNTTVAEQYNHVKCHPKPEQKLPFEIDFCGFGCVLLHRSVLEAMKPPYFRFLFDDTSPKTDFYVSEDTYFCVQARKKGFKIYAVPELACGHVGTAPVIGRADFEAKRSNIQAKDVKVAAVIEKEVVR